jgi:hypothetical protein
VLVDFKRGVKRTPDLPIGAYLFSGIGFSEGQLSARSRRSIALKADPAKWRPYLVILTAHLSGVSTISSIARVNTLGTYRCHASYTDHRLIVLAELVLQICVRDINEFLFVS